MMAYNTVEICMFTLFLHSLLLTYCVAQSSTQTNLTVSDTKILSEASSTSSEISTPSKQTESSLITAPNTQNVNECSPPPNITKDAISLKKAIEGFGTDVFTIIDLIAMRSNFQRQQIRKEFQNLYHQDLIKELKSDLSGDLQTTIIGLMLTNQEFYAKELHDAVAGIGTDDEALSEILGSLNYDEIQAISTVYQKEYKSKLKDDIIDDTSGYFQKLLVKLCEGKRASENEEVNFKEVQEDTHKLILAGFSSLLENTHSEEETLISILTTRSFAQLKEIFQLYEHLRKIDISNVLTGRYSSSLEYALSIIIRCANSKYENYATLLKQAMNGFGTNNRQLTRIIVGRSEKDLDKIKETYESKFHYPLIDQVADETSGEYRDLLMAILRK